MSRYIMALDAGTTSNRCILFDRQGRMASLAQKEFTQYFPQPGYVEHDPEEIWQTQLAVAREAMEKIGASASDIAAIGVANQRETALVWDRHTGKPVYKAIVWQCRRSAPLCDRLKEDGLTGFFRERTGLVIDAYFSATKISWILENVEGARERAQRGDLLFGTVESWLIWKLSGGKIHCTDYSNASRTMLFDIHRLCWDADILKRLSIPACMLPEVRPSSGVFGMSEASLFGAPIPIAGAAGDQQAALFGQGCFKPGEAKNTYGTGCFMLMHTGESPVSSQNGLVSTIAWGEGGKVEYALEGSIFTAGAAIQWLRDELGLIGNAAASETLARQVEDTCGCYVVPAFTGLGAPHWDAYARGTIVGLTRGCSRAHIVRATLDSLAYQVSDVLTAMGEDAGLIPGALRVDGGASANDYLMQTQADLIGRPVLRPDCVESTALGAAYLAGLAVGYWKSREEILQNRPAGRVFMPELDAAAREARLQGWRRALCAAKAWAGAEPSGI